MDCTWEKMSTKVQSIKSLPPQRGDLALGDKLECEKYVATKLKRNDSLW